MTTKRLRIFAGPNGSGKSTITAIVRNAGIHLGKYINADELKGGINETLRFDFATYLPAIDQNDFWARFSQSALFGKADGGILKAGSRFEGTVLCLPVAVNDYFTSFLSAYLREKMLDCCDRFTFETVMSHPSKVDYIRLAKSKGYRIYLYFVSLENPALNKERVAARVQQGGHSVPEDKITERYGRSMEQLLEAMRLADRAFIFDNSASEPKLLASVNAGSMSLADGIEYIPSWFKHYVIDRL